MKRTFLLCFYLVAGIVVGAMIASVCSGVPFLRWLAYTQSIGFNPNAPFVLDLNVFQLTLGFSFNINVAQIFTIAIALFAYNHTRLR